MSIFFEQATRTFMTPSIAVIIPNRNDAKYLGKCLDSVLNQEVGPDQIIVVDDQSTDDSLEVIGRRLANISCAGIVANPACLGTMGALNQGLKLASCDYVLFLSSNDYVESGIFGRAKSCIAAAGSPSVWSALVWEVDERGQRLGLYPSPVVALVDTFFSPEQCIGLANTLGHWFTGTTLIYHRETLLQIGGFDTAYQGMADMLAALTVASLKGAAFSPFPFGVIRRHDDGLMLRTLLNLPGLDAILTRMQDCGKKLSPALFTSEFCDLMNRRIRFTAIRASQNHVWLQHAESWRGWRYRVLCAVSPWLGKSRVLQLAGAFVLLRPLFDPIAIVWYRFLGRSLVLRKMR